VNSFLKKNFMLLAAACLFSGGAHAQLDTNVCTRQATVVFGFFNGVQNTTIDAGRSLVHLQRLYDDPDNSMEFELFYNSTNGMEDFAETFDQRLDEQFTEMRNRYELFFGSLRGGGGWWETIRNIPSLADRATDFLDSMAEVATTGAIASITRAAAGLSETNSDYLEHRQRINGHALEGRKFLFVAHSQGNLFVNRAYEYATAVVGADAVRTVHVAPASVQLNGQHVLADKDLVINGLRITGSVPPVTHDIPPILMRSPGLNFLTDWKGHGLLEIYLHPEYPPSARINDLVHAAIIELKNAAPPAAIASPGMFTATLEWDGSGDVDLHTYEPGGAHVYYAAKQGNAGYLDVDNIQGFGPEHYFASCDANQLQTGIYRIAVANYARAEGRRASVQIASWADGVLGTRQTVLGGETRDVPSVTLFEVEVSRDDSGQYRVQLVD